MRAVKNSGLWRIFRLLYFSDTFVVVSGSTVDFKITIPLYLFKFKKSQTSYIADFSYSFIVSLNNVGKHKNSISLFRRSSFVSKFLYYHKIQYLHVFQKNFLQHYQQILFLLSQLLPLI